MQIRWLRKALANLDDEAAYIAAESPAAAGRDVQRIFDAVALLASQPALGRPGRIPGTRELIVPGTRYLIPYRIRNGQVEILCVFPTSRQPPNRW